MKRLLSVTFLFAICVCLSRATPPFPSRKGKDIALFFAGEDYLYWPLLRHPISEVEQIAQELKQNYDFEIEIVHNPKRKTIYDKLEAYRDRTYAEDAQLLIFFSGHGEFLEATQEGFFVPIDGKSNDPYQDSYIPYDRLKKAIDHIPCRHILLAIDACYSGALDDQTAITRTKGQDHFLRKGSEKSADITALRTSIEDNLRFQTRFYVTSGDREKTPDRSQFARQMLDGLRSTTRQAPILTFAQLQHYLEKATPLPRVGEFGHNEPGLNNFLFIRNIEQLAAPPKAAVSDFPITTKLPSMIPVAAGSFKMGQSDPHIGGKKRSNNEQPVHEVSLSAFFMAETEVTLAQFQAFVVATGYQTDAEINGNSYVWNGQQWTKAAGVNWRFDAKGKRRQPEAYDRPVVHVSWQDALAYCRWLSEQTGDQYRLPTEAEWEFAAGGGPRDTWRSTWAGTNDPSLLHTFSNYQGLRGKDIFSLAAPVRSLEANELHLFDLSGNVYEWCQDVYGPYSRKPQVNPIGRGTNPNRVIRGGSWATEAPDLRNTYRSHGMPDLRRGDLGFRPVRE